MPFGAIVNSYVIPLLRVKIKTFVFLRRGLRLKLESSL